MLAHYNRQEHICAHNAAYSESFAPELLKEREGGDEKKWKGQKKQKGREVGRSEGTAKIPGTYRMQCLQHTPGKEQQRELAE